MRDVRTILMAAALAAIPSAASSRMVQIPARFICNAEGRCFEDGDLGDRHEKDDHEHDARRRPHHRDQDDDRER